MTTTVREVEAGRIRPGDVMLHPSRFEWVKVQSMSGPVQGWADVRLRTVRQDGTHDVFRVHRHAAMLIQGDDQ